MKGKSSTTDPGLVARSQVPQLTALHLTRTAIPLKRHITIEQTFYRFYGRRDEDVFSELDRSKARDRRSNLFPDSPGCVRLLCRSLLFFSFDERMFEDSRRAALRKRLGFRNPSESGNLKCSISEANVSRDIQPAMLIASSCAAIRSAIIKKLCIVPATEQQPQAEKNQCAEAVLGRT